MDTQNRRWLTVAVSVIAIAILAQAGMNTFEFFRARSDVHARLTTVSAHYHALEGAQLSPMLSLSLTSEERAEIESIRGLLRAVPAGGLAVAPALTEFQTALATFFAHPGFSAGLESDPHFLELNKEISGYGDASVVLREYNQAAAALHASMQTKTGKLLSLIFAQHEPMPLYPDGRTRDTNLFL